MAGNTFFKGVSGHLSVLMNCSGSRSINIPLKDVYGGSKGKSLKAFVNDPEISEETVIKLFSDLIDYYEVNLLNSGWINSDPELFNRCKPLILREKGLIANTPVLKECDVQYIRDQAPRLMKNLDEGDYDTALTHSRTLLEEVFMAVIEARDQEPRRDGNIKGLYAQVKELYNMKANPTFDKRINELLSGLEKILNSISEMRNKQGDAHGVGNTRLPIPPHYARLFVNSALTMAEFIMAVKENYEQKTKTANFATE